MNKENLTEITYGCDPEFFVSQGGVYMPAEITGVVGTKKKPMALPSGGAVQIDGCALEFNIAPAKDVDEFDKNIEMTLCDIRKIVSEDIEFDFRSDVTFTESAWEKVSEVNKELGCEPDYDAYTRSAKTPPAGSAEKPFRTAAGHIHIGFTKADPADPKHIFDCSMITMFLDQYVAYIEAAWSKPSKRKELYGSLGSFRPKPYGLEYRVLGNDWVSDKTVRRFVFALVDAVVKKALSGSWTYPPRTTAPSTYNHEGINPNNFLSSIYGGMYATEEVFNYACEMLLQNKVNGKLGYYIREDSLTYLHNIFHNQLKSPKYLQPLYLRTREHLRNAYK